MPVEPGTGLVILGGAIGSAKLVEKILGPTADYIGEGLRDWAEKRGRNVGRIFENAAAKLGGKIEQPGAVPPKVLKGILQEGAFCEDELSGQYFGGVLASSRSEVSRDDRGAAFISLISRLTTYQIRSHFIFYYLFKDIFNGESLSVTLPKDRRKMRIFIPFSVFSPAMDFSEKESLDLIVHHVMFGLPNESLIGEGFRYGAVEHLQKAWQEADSSGILVRPSSLGVELFLWAYGAGELGVNQFLIPRLEFPLLENIAIPSGSRRVREGD